MTYINEYQVLARPYWTKGHLSKVKPDLTAEHPDTGEPVRFYALETLQRVERTAAWQANINRQNLMELVSKASVSVEVMDFAAAQAEAVSAYNVLHGCKENFRPATPQSDPLFLQRITVNYLRHKHTKYDKTLKLIAGQHGKAQAYALLKNKTLQEIAVRYPQLAKECTNQRVDILEILRQLDFS